MAHRVAHRGYQEAVHLAALSGKLELVDGLSHQLESVQRLQALSDALKPLRRIAFPAQLDLLHPHLGSNDGDIVPWFLVTLPLCHTDIP